MNENHLIRVIFMFLPLINMFFIKSKLLKYAILIGMWSYISNDYLAAFVSNMLSLYTWIVEKVCARLSKRKK